MAARYRRSSQLYALWLIPVLLVVLLSSAPTTTADPTSETKSVDTVRLELPHTTRVGAKLFSNAPWLFGVDLKGIVDGHHEWFSLVKDKGNYHLQLNGYLHRLAGQVLQLQLLDSKTRQLAKKLSILVSGVLADNHSGSAAALKYLAAEERQPEPPAQPQPEVRQLPKAQPPPILPQFPVLATRRRSELLRSSSQEFVNRIRRQTSSRIIFRVSESAAGGSFLFAAVSPASPSERYIFLVPAPEEFNMDSTTSRVFLKLDQGLSFATKPSIMFSIVVLTADFRGIYRIMDYEVQVEKAVSLSPVISKYTEMAWTVLYRETETMDGAMLYRLDAKVPNGETANLTYEFIPGMESRSEGRFRVVPDLGLVVTKLNDGYPGAPKYYDLGVRAVNLNSTSPLTKYGYAFVRVFTTYQPPIFSQDSYTFYLNEETEPTKVGQIFCATINNMWSTVTLTANMRPSVSAVLSMDSNGTIYSRVRLDYDVPSNPKVWYFMAVCTENGTSSTPRSTEVSVAVQLVDINDNRPYFYIDYYVKPTLTPENQPVNTEVYRIAAIDSDSPVNAILGYSISGPGSELFNVTRDLVTNEAVLTLISPMDYEALPSGGKEYKFTIAVTDGVSGTSRRPTSTVVIGVQNINDNAPTIRNFSSVVDKNAPAGTNIIQMQVWDKDGSGIRYYFPTASGNIGQYPSAANNLFSIQPDSGMVSIGTAALSSLRDSNYVLPYIAIDDGNCDGCPLGGPQLSSVVGYLVLTVIDSNSAAPIFLNCPTGTVNYTDNSPAGTTLMTVRLTATLI